MKGRLPINGRLIDSGGSDYFGLGSTIKNDDERKVINKVENM